MPEPLEPNQDALKAWENLPKGNPSPDALPPAGGGLRWSWALLIGFALVILLGAFFRFFG